MTGLTSGRDADIRRALRGLSIRADRIRAGFIADKHIRGDSPIVHRDRWRPDGGPLVLDVREDSVAAPPGGFQDGAARGKEM